MVAKRIIPCLDIKGGRTVKGTKFLNLRDAGDPVELAAQYSRQGADELVFLDISATDEERSTTLEVVRQVARELTIPFTVGGGVRSVQDVARLLNAGADKISINSAAVRTPSLITDLAKEFGSQCVVVAIDTKRVGERDTVHVQAGKVSTEHETCAWAREVAARGAGEILLTSMDHDGTRSGFDLALTSTVSTAVAIPVVASGGAGTAEHLRAVLCEGAADAALAAGIFHDHIITIPDVKRFLRDHGVEVRL